MRRSLNIEILIITILVGAFGFTTSQRNFVWKDDYSLWSNCVEKSYEKARPHNNFGIGCYNRGMIDKAIFHYNEALKIKPKFAIAHNNLGTAMVCQGNDKLAIYHYNKALLINPDNAKAHNNLGVLLAVKGKFNDAFYHYQEVLRINPKYAGAYYNLGKIYANKGDIENAILYYKKTLQVSPNMAEALYNLSWITATTKDDKFRTGIEAIKLAEKLCKLQNYSQPLSLDALAAAYAETGKFKKAVITARKGLELALEMGPKELALGLENRLTLYQAGRPYRQ